MNVWEALAAVLFVAVILAGVLLALREVGRRGK